MQEKVAIFGDITIYIVSGGSGSVAEQMVNTVKVQFPNTRIKTERLGFIRNECALADIIRKVSKAGGILVHTMLDKRLREFLIDEAASKNVVSIDFIGDLMTQLTNMLVEEPLVQPGLYRKLHSNYFNRIEAIEFSMNHDDSKNLGTIDDAEIVLIGVSRVGKTPLSMYLAVHGWKVANIPLVKDIPVPPELDQVDRRRVIAMYSNLTQLSQFRKIRIEKSNVKSLEKYTNEDAIFDELEYFRDYFKKRRFVTIDITSKPIESSAQEILEIINSRLGIDAHKR